MKIFTKLRKSRIVRSSQGAKGGYELAKRAENISFWDIIKAVEGSSYMFQCAEIRQANILADETDACNCSKPCLIKVVMQEAEDQMRMYITGKTLAWLRDAVYKDFRITKRKQLRSGLQNLLGNSCSLAATYYEHTVQFSCKCELRSLFMTCEEVRI